MVLKYIRKLLGLPTESESLPPLPPLPAPASAAGPQVVHRPIARNLIDPEVIKIIHRLTRFGHTAYLVGGGVRDLLLHRTPKDFDIATSAQPHDVKKLFRNCRIIGRRFRLAHIFFRDKIIEVATFRANVPGEESGTDEGDLLIRSDNVFGTPETDALRRDFTINALFYDVDAGNVIDYVGGLPDLDGGVLRTIGDPDIRMREDPIRILRALRLAGRLGFRIDDGTLRAIRTHRDDIRRAAVPRILEDILRMLRGSGAETAFRGMLDTGILQTVMPELHQALTGSGREETTAAFWKALHAVDLATSRGTEFSNPTLLAALLYPRVAPALASAGDGDDGSDGGGGGGGIARALDAALSPIEGRLNFPRRDRDRIRQILIAQKRLQGGRRGRRFSAGAFLSRPFFPEAFDLFEILCSATGQHRDELRRWRERIASMAEQRGEVPPTGTAPEERRAGGDSRGRDGRRRRGRDGRHGEARPRREGTGDAGGDAPSPFADVPDRPDLSEEDIALIYGTVAVPAGPIATTGADRPAADRGAEERGAREPHRGHRRGRGPRHTGRREGQMNPGEVASAGGGEDQPEGAPRPPGSRRRRRGGRRHRRSGAGGAGGGQPQGGGPGGQPNGAGGNGPGGDATSS